MRNAGKQAMRAWLLLLLVSIAGCDLSCDGLKALDPVPDAFDREAFNFLVVGDWGRGGWLWQDDVADQMGKMAEKIDSRFVISTGDNFYEDGVASVTDRAWQSSFERVYTAPSLQRPWYAVLGNHDYRGSVQAQIDYSAHSDRWTMPARYYVVERTIDDTTAALFVFLDTEILVGGDEAEAGRQLRWLDSTLAHTEAGWRIVVGHRQLFAVRAGHGDAPALQRMLRPIFERRGVAAYLSGHVHGLQHLKPDGGEVHYLISGAGSLAHRLEEAPGDDALFAAAAPGFLAVSLTAAAMHVRFIDYEGRVGYTAAIARRRSTVPDLVPVIQKTASLPSHTGASLPH